ncbi:PLD nuclease N-terminal domain-containing protein [Streptomyces sp. HNM0574]|uniref:PLD nuclease N-terminal domain-containing protein n=1 Tax=Streptomyces sp. HNM0574 TaxID=2714954 RepID=UPI00146E9C4B|nr:PLD nuclease N-terminal domain-containing protein [Streptomyces sp. HNM0574]NLU70264.1 PLDc_N domain-containing protein [Streptomyces sp. HNM0574]
MLRYLPFVLVLAVWIYAFIDCLNTPEKEVRKLPKVAWVIIILLFGQVLLGPIVWFAVGRPRKNAPYGATKPQERRWVAPDDNPDFLKSLGEQRKDRPEPEQPPAQGESTADGQRQDEAPEGGPAPGPEATEEEARRRDKGGSGPEDTPPA